MRAIICLPLGFLLLVFTIPYSIYVFWPGRGVMPDETTGRMNPRIVNRAFARQTHIVLTLSACALLGVGFAPGSGYAEPWLYKLFGIGLAISGVLCGSQFALNRPKWVVPNRYRTEPGFVVDAWARASSRFRRGRLS